MTADIGKILVLRLMKSNPLRAVASTLWPKFREKEYTRYTFSPLGVAKTTVSYLTTTETGHETPV